MAATDQGAQLTEAHRLAQLRLGVVTVAAMSAVWPLLEPEHLDETFARWLVAAESVIQAQRVASARLAANYLAAFRAVETGDGAGTPILAEAIPTRAVRTSLLVTGPVAIKAAVGSGRPRDAAAEVAQSRSSGAAMRHALDGGRDTITRTVHADRRARGWQRVTSGHACTFCASLAGEVTRSQFSAHDHCACGAEPVYRS